VPEGSVCAGETTGTFGKRSEYPWSFEDGDCRRRADVGEEPYTRLNVATRRVTGEQSIQ